MLSPFPGMDPYLENPAIWSSVHHRLITYVGDYLASQVAPHFLVDIEERVYITHPTEDPGFPALALDVIILAHPQPASLSLPSSGLTITAPTVIERLIDDEVRDPFLVIRDANSKQVVTAIEILSPANKVKGARGEVAMREKRRALYQGGAQLLEIDLLRAGERPAETAHLSDYVVTLTRSDQAQRLAWFVNLRDPLPVVAVPLRPPFEDVPLPLQSLLDSVYQRGRYAAAIDYTRRIPPPPLKSGDRAWLERTLQAWQEAQ